jgi:uncharacterized protein (DUF58 family)
VFGSGQQSKLEMMVEIAALLMFSALRNNDKVGLHLFADDVVACYPPRKSKGNVLRLLREMLAAEPVASETNLEAALEYLNRVQKRRAVVFVISDFQTDVSRKALSMSTGRHDLVAITVSDPREHELPNVDFIRLQDAETGEIVEVDTRNEQVRQLFQQQAQERAEALSSSLRRAGVDQLSVSTREPYTTSLRRFFAAREKRSR